MRCRPSASWARARRRRCGRHVGRPAHQRLPRAAVEEGEDVGSASTVRPTVSAPAISTVSCRRRAEAPGSRGRTARAPGIALEYAAPAASSGRPRCVAVAPRAATTSGIHSSGSSITSGGGAQVVPKRRARAAAGIDAPQRGEQQPVAPRRQRPDGRVYCSKGGSSQLLPATVGEEFFSVARAQRRTASTG